MSENYQKKRVNVASDLSTSLHTAAAINKGLRQDWHTIIGNESHLLPIICRDQRTFRVAHLIPTWDLWTQTEKWWAIAKQINGREAAKYRAWWEVIYLAQRPEVVRLRDDTASLVFALLMVAQEKARRDHGKIRLLDSSEMGLPVEHATAIQEAILARMDNLLPREVAPGADVLALLRPKYDRQRH